MLEKIEIVMPVFDRPDRVHRTLNTFFEHTTNSPDLPYEYRFTIVNDGCWDFPSYGDWTFLQTSADHYIDLGTRKGMARSLNAGISSARAQWVLTIHSDILVHKNWIEEVLLEKERLVKKYPNLAWIGFNITNESGENQMSAGIHNEDFSRVISTNLDEPDRELFDFVHTKASFFKRSAYYDIGGPHRTYKEYFVARDLGNRFKQSGYKVAFSKNVSFSHQDELGIPKRYYVKDLRRYKWAWKIGSEIA